MARFNGKHFAASISDNLCFDRVPLLLSRVELALDSGQAGPSDGRLEAIDENDIYAVRMPGRLFLGPFRLGVPAMGRTNVA